MAKNQQDTITWKPQALRSRSKTLQSGSTLSRTTERSETTTEDKNRKSALLRPALVDVALWNISENSL